MTISQDEFLQALFDTGECVCSSGSVTGVVVHTQQSVLSDDLFICVNPLKESRKDDNVTVFRNILLEFDGMPLDEQLELIETIPHTTCVWSGNKSYHCIISLEQPCIDRAEYDILVRRIYAKVPQADKSGKNPSRFTRMAGAYRLDTKSIQTLKWAQRRITRDKLDGWLGPETTGIHLYEFTTSTGTEKRTLPIRTKAFLEYGAPEGERNRSLFANSCEMFRCGYTEEEIHDLVAEILDLPAREILTTIRSAKKKVGL